MHCAGQRRSLHLGANRGECRLGFLGSWEEETQDVSRGSDVSASACKLRFLHTHSRAYQSVSHARVRCGACAQEVESVFDEPVSRPRVKSLKRPEVVAQEKGIATVRLSAAWHAFLYRDTSGFERVLTRGCVCACVSVCASLSLSLFRALSLALSLSVFRDDLRRVYSRQNHPRTRLRLMRMGTRAISVCCAAARSPTHRRSHSTSVRTDEKQRSTHAFRDWS